MKDHKDSISRRVLLRGAMAGAAALVMAGAAGCAKKTAACYREENNGLRVSLEYVETSKDPARVCNGCQFFTATADSTCGQCKMFDGPANAGGHCNSWSPRTNS